MTKNMFVKAKVPPRYTAAAEAVNENKAAELQIGAAAADGWKYAGVSEDTREPMFVAPEDAGLMNWHDAMKGADTLKQQGKKDARLPSKGELKQLFNNQAKIGGFNTSGLVEIGGYYWSSTESVGSCARTQRFSDGNQDYHGYKDYNYSSVRFVRS